MSQDPLRNSSEVEETMDPADPSYEGIVPPANDGGTEVVNTPADNPAWSDFLSAVPESMHEMFKPHLAKWDEGVNNRIQQVHSEYSGFKTLKDSGYDADTLQQAAGIWDAINSDPRRVYEILAESYGFDTVQPEVAGQGQPGAVTPQPNQGANAADEYDITGGQFNPEVARLQSMTETMANILIAQQQERQVAEEDALLTREMEAAKQKYGPYDENYVLSLVQGGAEVEKAVQAYQNLVNQVLTNANRPTAPTVISGAGALPSQQVDPTKLNTADTRTLVANIMKASNSQGV